MCRGENGYPVHVCNCTLTNAFLGVKWLHVWPFTPHLRQWTPPPSSWYNCTGWLGVKHQVIYLLTPDPLKKHISFFCFFLSPLVYKHSHSWTIGRKSMWSRYHIQNCTHLTATKLNVGNARTIHASKNIPAEHGLDKGCCVCAWLSQERCEPRSAQLRRRAEHRSHFTACHPLPGRSGPEDWQTEDAAWAIRTTLNFHFKEWVNNCWWGWQNRTDLGKCTHLYDGIRGTVKHKRFWQKVFFRYEKIDG